MTLRDEDEDEPPIAVDNLSLLLLNVVLIGEVRAVRLMFLLCPFSALLMPFGIATPDCCDCREAFGVASREFWEGGWAVENEDDSGDGEGKGLGEPASFLLELLWNSFPKIFRFAGGGG